MPGRRISRSKCDQLRAAGKCFQCEETGHDQRNCPKLHSMRRPAMGLGSVMFVGVTGVVAGRDSLEGEPDSPETTEPERRAYELCAREWGDDARWLNVETRSESRYGIHQYDTGSHWGQGVVYQAGTLQIHCKDMDKVPTIYQPGHWKYIHNFPSQFLCSFPGPGNTRYIHSVPSDVTAVS